MSFFSDSVTITSDAQKMMVICIAFVYLLDWPFFMRLISVELLASDKFMLLMLANATIPSISNYLFTAYFIRIFILFLSYLVH